MLLRVCLLLGLFAASEQVDHAKFRTCAQTGFCRRHRVSELPHPYVVAPGSLAVDGSSGEVTGTLHGGPFGVSLSLRLIAYDSGAARLRITESNPLHGPRWEPDDILEAGLKTTPLKAVGAAELDTAHPLREALSSGATVAYSFAAAADSIVAITYHPFKVVLYHGDAPAITLNPAGKVRRMCTRPRRACPRTRAGALYFLPQSTEPMRLPIDRRGRRRRALFGRCTILFCLHAGY